MIHSTGVYTHRYDVRKNVRILFHSANNAPQILVDIIFITCFINPTHAFQPFIKCSPDHPWIH